MDNRQRLTDFVMSIIQNCNGEQLDITGFDEDDRQLVEALNQLSRYNYEAREFANQIAEGNLEGEAPARENVLSWPFRALRSSLSHLTWQSQCVAAGDYSQKVDFMGEFSEAFNEMIHQLSLRETSFLKTSEYQSEKLKEMETMAYKDEATGVYNRRYCMTLIDELLENHIPFCLGYIDLNNLKEVNDNYGHDAGDVYIKTAIQAIKDTLRKKDVVCRIGGDEIIVVLYHCTENIVKQRMNDSQDKIVQFGKEHNWALSISYGVLEIPENANYETADLLKEADRRMYEFKTIYKKEHHLTFH